MTPADDPYAAIARIFDRVRDSDAPLRVRLEMLAEAVRADSPDFAPAVDRLVASLLRSGLGGGAPGIGEAMPPFLLPDQAGRLVSLPSILARGPAVVSFYRGHWCPYCRLSALSFAGVQDLVGMDRMVAITPERQAFNQQLIRDSGIGYPVLTDADSGYAMSLNLAFYVGAELVEKMTEIGVDLNNFQTGAQWVLPIPATFVVDSGGRIVARHLDPDYRTRMNVDELLAALESAS